ncbi:MAG: DUF6748 domain-containing protein [Kofleriaceae bacterium]
MEDELAVEEADALDLEEGKADVGGTYTYYLIERDFRLCISPFCGGVFYRRANANTTKCIDGTKQDRCYAASMDLGPTNLDSTGLAKMNAGEGTLLVRATIKKDVWAEFGTFARVRVTEAWPGQLPVGHDGVVVKVEDTGLRCITYPCPSLREHKLNSSLKATLAEVGFEGSGASDEQVAAALEQMHTNGLIIAGDRYQVSGPAGTGKARSVTQFWLRATNDVCAIIDCAAPPHGCHYEGAQFTPCDQQTCGQLVCENPPF